VGEVFYAEDLKFDPPRVVGLKLIHPNVAADPQAREDIKREASTTARFNHPHILRVIDFEIEPDIAYIVTDLAAGGSLADKLRTSPGDEPRGLPLKDVGRYLEEIASALDEAHEQGLVHRDIKPQNILLDDKDQVLLADFGLATQVQGRKLAKVDPWGTAEYAAPEVWSGKVGKTSDIYALGALAYELITGKPPFPASEHQNLEAVHLGTKPTPIHQLSGFADFPEAADEVLQKALHKDPRHRYQSAIKFVTELKRALRTAEIAGKKAGSTTLNRTDINIPQPVPALKKRKLRGKLAYLPLLIGLLVIGFLVMNQPVKPKSSTYTSSASASSKITPIKPTATPKPITAPNPATAPISFSGHSLEVQTLALSPDGKILASGGRDSAVRLWDLSGKSLGILTGHYGSIQGLAWSPDGRILASASTDSTVRLWNSDGKALKTLKGHSGIVQSVAWSPDGKILASAGLDKKIILWQADGTLITQLEAVFSNYYTAIIKWSPDSKILAWTSADRTVRLASADGILQAILKGHTDEVSDLDWSPDGKTLASASWDKTIRLWDSTGKDLATLKGHTSLIWKVSWAPDGKTLASGSVDKTVRLWNSDALPLKILTAHNNDVRGLNWSPDGKKFASVSFDGTTVIWTADGTALNTIPATAPMVNQVVWTPDSTSVIAVSADERTLRLWNLKN
jgi:WD40 repeat protein